MPRNSFRPFRKPWKNSKNSPPTSRSKERPNLSERSPFRLGFEPRPYEPENPSPTAESKLPRSESKKSPKAEGVRPSGSPWSSEEPRKPRWPKPESSREPPSATWEKREDDARKNSTRTISKPRRQKPPMPERRLSTHETDSKKNSPRPSARSKRRRRAGIASPPSCGGTSPSKRPAPGAFRRCNSKWRRKRFRDGTKR